MHPVKPSEPINELEQYVVHVPNRYNGLDHIAIVRDAETGLHVIGNSENNLPIHHYSSAATTMCSYRAKLTVRGHVLLRGAKVRPEEYLKCWRSVIPCTPDSLLSRYGLALYANLELDLAAERESKWSGYSEGSSKIVSLDQFLSAYPVDEQGNGSIRLDSHLAFADLNTFHANRAREQGGNYDPKSRVFFTVKQVLATAKPEPKAVLAYQQAELI